MANDDKRSVQIDRVERGQYTATNARGTQIRVGTGDDAFTPVELLLAAIAGCTAVDVDFLTSRRSEPDKFVIKIDADKIQGHHVLSNIEVTFQLAFPEGAAGDAARKVLPDAVAMSHDRLCTVGRTIEEGTPIYTRIDS